MAVHNIANIRNVRNCAAILIVIDDSSATTVDFDTVLAAVHEILNA